MTDNWCPVCGRDNTWGCGHSSEQRRAARKHNATVAHRSGRCSHYDHSDCDPKRCARAGDSGARPGWVPMMTHREAERRYNEEQGHGTTNEDHVLAEKDVTRQPARSD